MLFVGPDAFHPSLARAVAWVAGNCPGLTGVDVGECRAMPSSWVTQLCSPPPHGQRTTPITSLRLAGAWALRDASPVRAAAAGGALRLVDCSGTGLVATTAALCSALMTSAGALRVLRLAGLPGTGHRGAAGVGMGGYVHGLYAADAAGGGGGGGAGGGGGGVGVASPLGALLSQCTALEELDLSGCEWLSPSHLRAVGAAQAAEPRLQRLLLRGCSGISGGTITLLAPDLGSSLLDLDLGGTRVDDDAIAAVAQHCTRLESLSLRGCLLLEAPALRLLASAPALTRGRLRRLCLAALPRVDDVAAAPLLAALVAAATLRAARGVEEEEERKATGSRRRSEEQEEGGATADFPCPLLAAIRRRRRGCRAGADGGSSNCSSSGSDVEEGEGRGGGAGGGERRRRRRRSRLQWGGGGGDGGSRCGGGLVLDLSDCGGLRDMALLALVPDHLLDLASSYPYPPPPSSPPYPPASSSPYLPPSSSSPCPAAVGTLCSNGIGRGPGEEAGSAGPGWTSSDDHHPRRVTSADLDQLLEEVQAGMGALRTSDANSDAATMTTVMTVGSRSSYGDGSGGASAIDGDHGVAAAAAAMAVQPPPGPVDLECLLQPAGPVDLECLLLSGCSGVSVVSLDALACTGMLSALRHLDLSHCAGLRSDPHAERALRALLRRAPPLRRLAVDGCRVGDGALRALGDGCGATLRELSMVGCKGVTDAGLAHVASRCVALRTLALGGPLLSWTEAAGLAAFSGLTSLRLYRRSHCTDAALSSVLANHPGLVDLTLASVGPLTDAALAALPRESLRTVSLVCMDAAVTGAPLARLRALRVLRLTSCPGVSAGAVRSVLLCCRWLQELDLPAQLGEDEVVPIIPGGGGHLGGVRIRSPAETRPSRGLLGSCRRRRSAAAAMA